MIILAYAHAASGHSLVDTFMRSAVWSVARRFINTLPPGVILVVSVLFLGAAALRRLFPKRVVIEHVSRKEKAK